MVIVSRYVVVLRHEKNEVLESFIVSTYNSCTSPTTVNRYMSVTSVYIQVYHYFYNSFRIHLSLNAVVNIGKLH